MENLNPQSPLKDNMSSAIQKNMREQKQFQEQVNHSAQSIKNLGKLKANPVVRLKDEISRVLGLIRSWLALVGRTVSAPIVRVRDRAMKTLTLISARVKTLGAAIASPIIRIQNRAAAVIRSVGSGLKAVGKVLASPLIRLRDRATGAVKGIRGLLQNVSQVFRPQIQLIDRTKQVLKKTQTGLKKVGRFIAKPFVILKDAASAALKGIKGSLKTLSKGVSIAVKVVKNTALDALKDGSMLEQQQISIEHFIGASNQGADPKAVKKMSESYLGELRKNANGTQFDTSEVMSVGANAIKASGGDTNGALQLLKIAEDMAALNPEKSLSDAMKALTDMKNGQGEGMKEFGMNVSELDMGNSADTMSIIENQIAPYFEGGAEKQAGSAGGMVSTIKGKLHDIFTDTGLAIIEKSKPLLEQIMGIVDKLAPKMKEVGEKIAQAFGKGVEWISALVEKAGGIDPIFEGIGSLFQNVAQVFETISGVIGSALGEAMPFIQIFCDLIQRAMPIVQGVLSIFCGTVSTLMPVVSKIFKGVADKVGVVIDFISSKMDFIRGIFETVCPIVADILGTAWDLISPMIDVAITVFEALWEVVEFVFTGIEGVIESVWGVLSPIFDAMADALGWVGEAVGSIKDWFGDVFSGVFGGKDGSGSTKSRAVGVGRVPYDNYPIVAHQGEMLLNRVEADRYQRDVGTRGAQMGGANRPIVLHRDNSPKNTHPAPVGQATRQTGAAIEVKVDFYNAVIEKDANVDEFVGAMVKKFNRIIPNMA